MNFAGQHTIFDAQLFNYPGDDAIMKACEKAIAASGMTVISGTYKRFDPHGLTAVWILAESHFTVHTFPEHAYLSVDCYTCGDEGNPDKAIEALRELLAGNVFRSAHDRLGRGFLPVRGDQGEPATLNIGGGVAA